MTSKTYYTSTLRNKIKYSEQTTNLKKVDNESDISWEISFENFYSYNNNLQSNAMILNHVRTKYCYNKT